MKKEIKKIFNENVEELAGVEITDDLQLITSGYVDSFDIMSVIGIMETQFGIEINLESVRLEDFNTVDSINQMIESMRA